MYEVQNTTKSISVIGGLTHQSELFSIKMFNVDS